MIERFLMFSLIHVDLVYQYIDISFYLKNDQNYICMSRSSHGHSYRQNCWWFINTCSSNTTTLNSE
ncbi:hypothetical protein BpHYR1_023194 [Brachionus plicatilis]|uniref:Uncharacterized protein n=1 Tax=Brachionus plicatilis TaxID=10195 RepID=A0A3M7PTQ7_BRAPC|nr:hypothetical protein BpHYR1_023194 [Brachionus plicatilis]